MKLKFMVDESAGSSLAESLREDGHDVLDAAQIMRSSEDLDVLKKAREEHRILITNDKDFGELAFRMGQSHEGILLIRLHREDPVYRIRYVKSVLQKYVLQLKGNFTVITESEVRIRPPDF